MCSSLDEQVEKNRLHTMEYYSDIKRNEFLPFVDNMDRS